VFGKKVSATGQGFPQADFLPMSACGLSKDGCFKLVRSWIINSWVQALQQVMCTLRGLVAILREWAQLPLAA
jgi:hypothetical protein